MSTQPADDAFVESSDVPGPDLSDLDLDRIEELGKLPVFKVLRDKAAALADAA